MRVTWAWRDLRQRVMPPAAAARTHILQCVQSSRLNIQHQLELPAFAPGQPSLSRATHELRRAGIIARAAAGYATTPDQPSAQPLLRERIIKYENLTGDDFRHPLDQQNTSLLRSLPGLELVAKSIMGPVAEQVLLLENIANSIQTGEQQMPSIYRLLTEAAAMLQMEPPELYVRQNPIPNAYTLAIAGRKPFIVVHTALLELLTPAELQAVLAHELGHLKCDHGLWLTVANVIASGAVSMLPIVSGAVEDALMRWLRAAELTCDRAALLVAQDPKVVISALMKLAGGSPSFASELNVEAFLQQARSYEEATSSVVGWYLRNAQTRALSHPLPVMRAREVDRWSQSPEFRGLLVKNSRHRVQQQQPAATKPSTGSSAAAVGAAGAMRSNDAGAGSSTVAQPAALGSRDVM